MIYVVYYSHSAVDCVASPSSSLQQKRVDCIILKLACLWFAAVLLDVSSIPLSPRSEEPPLNWAEHLTNPSRFSKETSGAIVSGVLTKRARVEIHNSIATLMLVHTSRPTSSDCEVVCRCLVQKYPTLKDSSDTGYVSLY